MKKIKSKINLYINTKKVDKFDFDIMKISKLVVSEFANMQKIKNNIEVDITLLTNAKIRNINKKERNIDKPTDVLSFPMCEMDYNTNFLFLGDVMISVDKLISQSKMYNHSMKREYAFLLTHSLLHLIGYDHMKKNEEKIMFSIQDKILKNININR